MTGPIKGSSVETQARHWIFKIVLLDFQRMFHRYTLQSQWSDIRLSDTAKLHAIYNFLLRSHAQTKTLMYRKGQKTTSFQKPNS